jgi:multidrug efflux pump
MPWWCSRNRAPRRRPAGSREAALLGSAEVSFTVISMSLSLIAVFIPILLMPGIVGLLFHEFAVTLSIAILISLLVSLTVTPTMCAYLLRNGRLHSKARWALGGGQFERFKNAYSRSLTKVLDHALLVGWADRLILLNVLLFRLVPSTFFPGTGQRPAHGADHCRSEHFLSGDEKKLSSCRHRADGSRRASVIGFTGTRALNTANVYVALKPLAQRHLSADQVVQRLRPKLNKVSGAGCSCRRCRTCASAAGNRPPNINTR